jgi:hypothetical protein
MATVGKVVSVDLNKEFTTKDGSKTYTAHELVVDVGGPKPTNYRIGVDSPAGKFVPKLNLKEGDSVVVETGGKFNSVTKVSKSGSSSSVKSPYTAKSSTSTYKDNTQGMIKGNSVTNAVQLAIAIHGKSVNMTHIEALARQVMQVHANLDKSSEAPDSSDAF